jgi:CheY-like chemotaxis protein
VQIVEKLTKTILIIDDEIYARDNLGRIIERFGYSIHTVSNGEDGIAA